MWQEDEKKDQYQVPENVVDLAYALKGRTLPVDHVHSLAECLHQELPWLAEEDQAGIHSIHVAASGNGWYVPEGDDEGVLYMSRRTKLILRLPSHRLDEAHGLSGVTLDIRGHMLEVGAGKVRPLSGLTTLFARHIVTRDSGNEEDFLNEILAGLRKLEIQARKILPGRAHRINTPDGGLFTRSVMVADISVEDSVKLQEFGLGSGRKLGCGLFIPHKGISPVKKDSGD